MSIYDCLVLVHYSYSDHYLWA